MYSTFSESVVCHDGLITFISKFHFIFPTQICHFYLWIFDVFFVIFKYKQVTQPKHIYNMHSRGRTAVLETHFYLKGCIVLSKKEGISYNKYVHMLKKTCRSKGNAWIFLFEGGKEMFEIPTPFQSKWFWWNDKSRWKKLSPEPGPFFLWFSTCRVQRRPTEPLPPLMREVRPSLVPWIQLVTLLNLSLNQTCQNQV